jgi:hypothetical protein
MADAPLSFSTLLRRLEEIGAKLRLNPKTRRPELIPPRDADLKAECDKLVPECVRMLAELRDHVALRCRVCKRDVTDPEDVERLRGINLFCGEIGCPYRRHE